ALPQLRPMREDVIDDAFDLRHARLVHHAVVHGRRVLLVLHDDAGNAFRAAAQLIGRGGDGGRDVTCDLEADAARFRPGDVEAVAAGVVDVVEADAPRHVLAVAPADDRGRPDGS